MKYLDEAGLSYLLSKLKDIYAAKGETSNSINAAVVALDSDSFENDGQPHAPKITSVTLGDAPLVQNVDYAAIAVPASAGGTYSALAIGIGQYTGAAAATWRVRKPSPKLQLSSSGLTVKGIMGTSDSSISITHLGGGQLSAESLDPQYATASVVGSALRVTSVKPGSATILVRLDEDAEYDSAEARLSVQIQRADGSISVEPRSLELEGAPGTTATATITRTGSGQVSVSSGSCVTGKVSGDQLTLTLIGSGSDSLTLSLAETDDYTEASCTLSVSVSIVIPPPSTTLADNSWATIAQVAAEGKAQEYWKAGDIGPKVTFTLPVADADGRPTEQTTELTCAVRILGFDHDELSTTDEKFFDMNYNGHKQMAAITFEMVGTTGEAYRMDDDGKSTGWVGTDDNTRYKNIIRQQVLASTAVDEALAPYLRSVRKKSGRYSTNNLKAWVSDERLSIVSVMEVLGTTSDTVDDLSTQYEFYKNGGSKRKQNPTGAYSSWWTRSVVSTTKGQYKAYQSLGFAGNTISTTPVPISLCFFI